MNKRSGLEGLRFLAAALGVSWIAACSLDEPHPGNGTPSFPPGATPATLTILETASLALPFSAAVSADFNGDGRTDLALKRSTIDPAGPAAAADIFLADAANQYPALPTTTVPLDPASADVAAADFDGDGEVDLAVAVFTDPGGGRVDLFLGLGDGTFQPAVAAFSGIDAVRIGAGDFDADGDADLVVSGGLETRGYPNQGGGAFGAPTILSFPCLFAVSDVNGDGRSELAAIEWTWDTRVRVYDDLLGTPVLVATLDMPVDHIATCVIAAALGGTGGTDIAAGTVDQNTFAAGVARVFRTNALGFDPPVDVGGLPVMKVAAADYDGDGRADLITYQDDGASREVTAAIGQPAGTYVPVPWVLPSDPTLVLRPYDRAGSPFTGILMVTSTQSILILGSSDTTLPPSF